MPTFGVRHGDLTIHFAKEVDARRFRRCLRVAASSGFALSPDRLLVLARMSNGMGGVEVREILEMFAKSLRR